MGLSCDLSRRPRILGHRANAGIVDPDVDAAEGMERRLHDLVSVGRARRLWASSPSMELAWEAQPCSGVMRLVVGVSLKDFCITVSNFAQSHQAYSPNLLSWRELPVLIMMEGPHPSARSEGTPLAECS